MLTIDQLLRFAVAQKASDLHLSAGEPPMLRIHGDIERVERPPLTPEDTHRLLFDVITDAQRRAFQEKLEVDFAFALDDDLRFRVNAFVQNRGEGAVFRTIPTKIPKLRRSQPAADPAQVLRARRRASCSSPARPAAASRRRSPR